MHIVWQPLRCTIDPFFLFIFLHNAPFIFGDLQIHFVIMFTLKMFCSFRPRCCVAPGMAWVIISVCVCVLPDFDLAGGRHHAVTVFTLS